MDTIQFDESDCSTSSCNNNSESDTSEEILSEADILEFCGNTIFIAMCGFRSNFGRFICKEFCLVDTDGSVYHKFVKPPYPQTKLKYIHKVKVNYEVQVGHRIPYDFGSISIGELITDTYHKLQEPVKKVVMVRHQLDERRLKYIYRNYFDFSPCLKLTDLNFDQNVLSSKLNLLPYCNFHNEMYGWGSGECAKNISLKLRYIFIECEKNKLKSMEVNMN